MFKRFRLIGLASVYFLLLVFAVPTVAQTQQDPSADQPNTTDYRALAALLEDEHARRVLIEELRMLDRSSAADGGTAAPSASEIAAQSPSDIKAEEVSLARRMAATTASIGSGLVQQFGALRDAIAAFGDSADPAAEPTVSLPSPAALSRAALHLALLVAVTFAVFLLLRKLATPAFNSLSRWAGGGSENLAMVRTIVAVALAAAVDVLTVCLSYGGGGVLAGTLAGDDVQAATRLALFLNAFLIVELIKVALRMCFAGRHSALRLLPIDAGEARYCNRVLATIAGFVGYGVLVLVPIVNFNLSAALGTGLSTLIVLLASVYAAVVVLKCRSTLGGKLQQRAEQSYGPGRVALSLLARCWHLLALAYIAAVLVVSILHPQTALPFVAIATLKTLIYAGVGLLLAIVMRQLIGKEIQLSEGINSRIPRLQPRLNTYVPGSLKLLRALIVVAVILFSLDAWSVYDLAAWYATDAGVYAVSALIDILIILAVAAAVWVGAASLIEHRLTPKEDTTPAAAARAKTLMGLFHSALAITIIVMTVMIVLAEIGVNIGPLIAGAGVLGLAVGFGAQKLVQDVITGVFIQLENAMNTGDFVAAGSNSGTVERVGIRSVALRDLYGTYHIVPFSSVDAVSNYTREFGNHVGEYGIAYRENIDEAITHLHAAFEELKEGEHKDNILAPLNVAGVVALADSSVNIRVVIKTTPGNQWAVGRAYNRLVKIHFDKAGIEIPFPHTTLYFGEDKDGGSPAGNIRLQRDSDRIGDASVVSDQGGSKA